MTCSRPRCAELLGENPTGTLPERYARWRLGDGGMEPLGRSHRPLEKQGEEKRRERGNDELNESKQ